MRQKLALLLLAAAFGAGLAGCGDGPPAGRDDSRVEASLADLNAFTQELVARVEGAPDPAAGVADAQRYLDSRKADIAARLRPLAGDARLDEEARKKVLEQRTEAEMSVSRLQHRYFADAMRDPAFKASLGKLIADYQGLLKGLGGS